MKLTVKPEFANQLNRLRAEASDGLRKSTKKTLFALLKGSLGINGAFKLSIETDSSEPDYLVIKVGKGSPVNVGMAFSDDGNGSWDGRFESTAPAPTRYGFKFKSETVREALHEGNFLNAADGSSEPPDGALLSTDMVVAGGYLYLYAEADDQ